MKIRLILLSILFFSIIGCKTVSNSTEKITNSPEKTVIPPKEHTVQSLLWQQQAAEYKALCHQAYNIAKLRLDSLLLKQYDKPVAIVTDIDETVLDNSAYNARMVQSNRGFTKESWLAWGKELKAKAIPGALDFFQYAARKGVTIFYLSNRYDEQKPETILNLKKVGFPKVDPAHVLLRTHTGRKKPRRDLVAENYTIILLFGDNLSDFSEAFDKQPTAKRNALVDQLQGEFGKKFIILPNPMYGDWENQGIYEGKYSWSARQKDSIRKAKLRLN